MPRSTFRLRAILLALPMACAFSAQAASLGLAGYTQSFDGMGTTGTAAPIDWSVWVGASGTSNATWTTAIPTSGVAAMVASTAALTATSSPTATNNNGYNAARSSTATADRVLATSPTLVSGAALQLTLTNDTGASLSSVAVAYDTVRFTAASTANELPGYFLFYSLDNGTSWTDAVALDPSLSTVPNTVGVTSAAGTVALSSAVAAGGTVELRWVDDNAQQTSPDQIIGLNNVNISAVPELASLQFGVLGVAFLGAFAARRRAGDSL